MSTVKAYPRKQFFIEMFTRDLTLEDCILDLVDNAMDSYLRTREIDVSAEVFGQADGAPPQHPGTVRIDFSPEQFSISDNCGGIDRKAAEEDVFCFGHSRTAKPKGGLGVYGIGLKRAIFKLGNLTKVKSSAVDGSFTVVIDVLKWSQQEEDLAGDWTFPIEDHDERSAQWDAGTTITITGRVSSALLVRLSGWTQDAHPRRNARY